MRQKKNSIWMALPLLAWSTLASAGLYDLKVKDIDGKETSLNKYKGNVALVVNTASQCGYTSQYKGLEATYRKFSPKKFVVLGFPSNDFGGQEPGTNADIRKFCEQKFAVTFPLFSKEPVKGDGKQEVYKFLTTAGDNKAEVKWNFEKFLVNRKGEVIARFPSSVAPDAPELTKAIEAELAK